MVEINWKHFTTTKNTMKNCIYNDCKLVDSVTELPFTDILSEIELESISISVIDEMRQYLQNITFPLQLDEVVEVLDVDITTGEVYHLTFWTQIQ